MSTIKTRKPRSKLRMWFWVVLLSMIPITYFVSRWISNTSIPPLIDQTNQRIQKLRVALTEARRSSDQSVDSYQPKIKGNINQLDTSARKILRRLPGITRVDWKPTVEKPTHRIIHILDAHYVPLESIQKDIEQQVSRTLTRDEMQALSEALVLEAEIVQTRQKTMLRCLQSFHQLHSVFVGGVAPERVNQFEKNLKDLNDRVGLARVGAVGQLAIRGELKALACEDARLLNSENSRKRSKALRERREDAIVKALLTHPVSIIFLSATHDLSNNLRRIEPRCEYLRVKLRGPPL